MKVVRSNLFTYLVFAFLIFTFTVFIWNKSTDIETKLDGVKLKTEINEIAKNSFAIMVEKEDGSGYEEADTFPSDMTLNPNLSGCIDEDGKSISGSLLYKDGKVSVYVNSTAYCYLYFYNDDEIPVVSVSVINNDTEDVRMLIASSESGTYCVNTSSTVNDMSNCAFEGIIYGNTTLTTNAFESSGTYYAHVQDGAGNVGVSSSVSVKLPSNSFGLDLLETPTTGLNTTLEGGLYRYQGASGTVNNYICFGISDKDTCLNNTDAYLYRIIGIAEDGKIKVIKNFAMNNGIVWHSSMTNTSWQDSSLKSAINGSTFLTNTTYVPNDWSEKIEDTTWKYGDIKSVNMTAAELYNTENAWSEVASAKISLMYLHDYAYAYQSGGLDCSSSGAYTTCVKSWIHLSICDSGAPSSNEWTMSRYGLDGYSYYAWFMYPGGNLHYGNNVNTANSVRPVFFLKSEIQLIGGTGKSDDPFIIS